MLKAILAAAAAVSLAGLCACEQGPAEKAGQAADSAYEQSTKGQIDPTDGPAENAGEAIDNTVNSAPTPPTETAPAPTTP